MATAKLTKYQEGEDWVSVTEQLSFYFIANDITDEWKQKAVLLSSISQATFQLVKDLIAPNTPEAEAVTYESIVRQVKEHVKPEKTLLVARKELHDRLRKC